MWRCSCNYKNNNSKIQCGKCDKIREGFTVKDIPVSQRDLVRDYCPVCRKHTDFKNINNKYFACQSCHKKFKMIGKPIPELPVNERQDAKRLVDQIHVEQIKALKSLE